MATMPSAVDHMPIAPAVAGSLGNLETVGAGTSEGARQATSSFVQTQQNPIRGAKVLGPSASNKLQADPLDTSGISALITQRTTQKAGLLIDGKL